MSIWESRFIHKDPINSQESMSFPAVPYSAFFSFIETFRYEFLVVPSIHAHKIDFPRKAKHTNMSACKILQTQSIKNRT
jgi:hypothetical protein